MRCRRAGVKSYTDSRAKFQSDSVRGIFIDSLRLTLEHCCIRNYHDRDELEIDVQADLGESIRNILYFMK